MTGPKVAVIEGMALRLEAPGHFKVAHRHDVVLARDGFGLCSCGGSRECRHLLAALAWANADLSTVAPELMEEL
ncbi:MAG TPA: hypothetical protein VFD01_08015 [Candidatus Dormibacteraeota bacterium]|nr:hypothetical protein [Candidatus Dormibacteraeota bacterium]